MKRAMQAAFGRSCGLRWRGARGLAGVCPRTGAVGSEQGRWCHLRQRLGSASAEFQVTLLTKSPSFLFCLTLLFMSEGSRGAFGGIVAKSVAFSGLPGYLCEVV